jgi:hypothetical protein
LSTSDAWVSRTDASGLARFTVFFAYAEAEHAMWRAAG